MQQISRENLGVRYLFVAVNTSIRFLWVVGVKSKTSKACSEALKKLFQLISNEMLQRLVQPKINPENIWAYQGKVFAVEFAEFRKENRIELYSTRNETKSTVAERYIKTLKTIIFKYLHERDTNRYIDQLHKFVSIINFRITRMTKLAPIEVPQEDVPDLIFLCKTVSPQQQTLKGGD